MIRGRPSGELRPTEASVEAATEAKAKAAAVLAVGNDMT